MALIGTHSQSLCGRLKHSAQYGLVGEAKICNLCTASLSSAIAALLHHVTDEPVLLDFDVFHLAFQHD